MKPLEKKSEDTPSIPKGLIGLLLSLLIMAIFYFGKKWVERPRVYLEVKSIEVSKNANENWMCIILFDLTNFG